LSTGNLDARFDAAIGPGSFAQCQQAGGGIVFSVEIFASRLDDQFAIFNPGIVGTQCVILQLFVPPTESSGVVAPQGRVRRAAVGLIEFIAPNEAPAGERRGVGASGGVEAQQQCGKTREARKNRGRFRRSPVRIMR